MGDVPLIFEKYEVTRRLAVGGMGEIFLARQVGLAGFDRPVILKRLLSELAGQPGLVDQFLDEARVAATLSHANIVSIYEVGLWQGNYFIAMEYVHGHTVVDLVRGLLRKESQIPPAIAAKICHDAALGLEHAHQARDGTGQPLKIVHRDINPPNIMVRDDGVVKVLDFGIARAANRAVKTSTGALKGKMGYMPPEQITGQELDGRADQYALGVMLWELCARQRLFQDDNPVKIIHQVLEAPVAPLSAVRADIPEALEKIVARMVQRDREARYASCAEVARHLRQFIDLEAPETDEHTVAEFMRETAGEIGEQSSEDVPISNRDFMIDLRPGTPSGERLVPFDGAKEGAAERSAYDAMAPRRRLFFAAIAGVALGVMCLGGYLGWRFWARPPPAAKVATKSPTSKPVAVSGPAVATTPPEQPVVVNVVTTPPGATVLVGTRILGVTPLKIDTLAADVDHLLSVERRGFEPVDVPVRLSPGETKKLELTLVKAKPGKARPRPGKAAAGTATAAAPAAGGGEDGFLTLRTSPWTNVTIDGEPYGPSPLFKTKLTPGKHTVRLVNEQSGIDVTRTVTIRAGESEKVTWELAP